MLAAAASASAVALALGHRRRVRSRPGPGADALLSALRRVPAGERATQVARMAPPGSWEADLASEVASARGGDALAVEVDAALGDLEAGLVAVRTWSATALRLGLLGGLLGAALAAMASALDAALVAAGIGAVGAVAAGALGRRTAADEIEQRRRADDLVSLLLGGRAGGAALTRARGGNPRS